MNDVQKIQLNILVFFHDFCVKHNLKYFLCGGTCLGAIRHKGFIPWDDDIDVMMPRSDYDRFIKLYKDVDEGSNHKYFLQSYQTDKNYIYNFAKIRDNDTTFVESFFKYANINQGVWIDIFPLDGLGVKEKTITKQLKRFHFTWNYTRISFLKDFIRVPRAKYFLTDIIIDIFCILFVPFNINNRLQKKVDRITTKYPYEKSLAVASCQDELKCKKYEKGLFDELILTEFEGHQLYVPAKYDEYLRKAYGDYMCFPPKEQQVGHHYSAYENYNLSWRDYKKNYRKW